MATLSFNLIREPWIPIFLANRSIETWSMCDVLAKADEISDLAISSPLTTNAVMRYLLAILHRTYQGPRTEAEWRAIWDTTHFDRDRIDDYLHRFESRFDLFDPERPFAQVQASAPIRQLKPGTKKGETLLGELKPAMQMHVERTDNKTLSYHQRNDRPASFSPAEAARMLLTQHAYALGGGNSYPFRRAESPGIAGYAVMLEGKNLFETLTLNLNHYGTGTLHELPEGPDDDSPWWELEGADPEPLEGGTVPRGLTDLLTWRSRQILLDPDPDGTITHYYMQQGYKLPAGTPPDPFMSLRQLKDGRYIAAKFDEAKALWRDSSALIEHQRIDVDMDGSPTRRPEIIDWFATISDRSGESLPAAKLRVVGAGKSEGGGNFATVRLERLTVPRAVLGDDVLAEQVKNAVQVAETTFRDLSHAMRLYVWAWREGASDLDQGKPIPKTPMPDKGDLEAIMTASNVAERYWSSLGTPFNAFLEGLVGNPNAAFVAWVRQIVDAATHAFNSLSSVDSGSDVRQLRAAVLGQERLRYRLGPLNRAIREFEADDRPEVEEA